MKIPKIDEKALDRIHQILESGINMPHESFPDSDVDAIKAKLSILAGLLILKDLELIENEVFFVDDYFEYYEEYDMVYEKWYNIIIAYGEFAQNFVVPFLSVFGWEVVLDDDFLTIKTETDEFKQEGYGWNECSIYCLYNKRWRLFFECLKKYGAGDSLNDYNALRSSLPEDFVQYCFAWDEYGNGNFAEYGYYRHYFGFDGENELNEGAISFSFIFKCLKVEYYMQKIIDEVPVIRAMMEVSD